jgi:hypothetical protein
MTDHGSIHHGSCHCGRIAFDLDAAVEFEEADED